MLKQVKKFVEVEQVKKQVDQIVSKNASHEFMRLDEFQNARGFSELLSHIPL